MHTPAEGGDEMHTPAEGQDARRRERARERGTGAEAGASGVEWEAAVSAVSARVVQGHTQEGFEAERKEQSFRVADAEGESEEKKKGREKEKGKVFSEMSEDELRPLDDGVEGVRGLVSEEHGEATLSANPAVVSTSSSQPSSGRNNRFSRVLY